MWKKVCGDESKRLRTIRRRREQDELYNLRSKAGQDGTPGPSSGAQTGVSAVEGDAGSGGANDVNGESYGSTSVLQPECVGADSDNPGLFVCSYPDCAAVRTLILLRSDCICWKNATNGTLGSD